MLAAENDSGKPPATSEQVGSEFGGGREREREREREEGEEGEEGEGELWEGYFRY